MAALSDEVHALQPRVRKARTALESQRGGSSSGVLRSCAGLVPHTAVAHRADVLDAGNLFCAVFISRAFTMSGAGLGSLGSIRAAMLHTVEVVTVILCSIAIVLVVKIYLMVAVDSEASAFTRRRCARAPDHIAAPYDVEAL